MIDVESILGSQGRIAARLPKYEFREQQIQMANAVADAIDTQQHLIVEAGTGVGKSFGYLVPAILSLASGTDGLGQNEKRRIVVSTHTISLQEQLMSKDIPLLNSVIPLEFSAVLAKGRNNYVSLRRVKNAIEKADGIFGTDDEHFQLKQISKWSRESAGGSRSELDFRVLPQVWDEVQSDTSNCMGRNCPTYEDCHYYRARKRLQNADLIVVNHALFFVDLALRKKGINLLPDYDMVVLDEAHTVQDVASSHLGIGVTRGQIEFTLNKLYNEKRNKGLFVSHKNYEGVKLVQKCKQQIEHFFSDLMAWALKQRNSQYGKKLSQRVPRAEVVENLLSPILSQLASMVKDRGDVIEDASEKLNFHSAADRLTAVAAEIEDWRLQRLDDGVYWVESSTNRFGRENVSLKAAPIDIGPELRTHLFNKVKTCVLTSATIAVGSDSFEYFQQQVGLTQSATKKLGSPFNFRDQARLIVIQNIADPTRDKDTHQRQAIEAIQKYVSQTDGRAFVLCTSYSFLNRAVADLTPWLASQDLAVYSQSAGIDRSQLLQQFKLNPRGVLFGTDSFWQGVDVPGDALQNVIIPKLPFSVPDQPLLEARLEAIRKRGGNPFNEHQLPEAIIKFKQGFGRLIRSQSDSGIVVVLDPRIRNKPYGRYFVESLPQCSVESAYL